MPAPETRDCRGSRGQKGEGGTWLVPVLPPAGGEERTKCPGSCTQVMEGPFLPQPVVRPEESTLQSKNEGVCSSWRTCKQGVSQAAARGAAGDGRCGHAQSCTPAGKASRGKWLRTARRDPGTEAMPSCADLTPASRKHEERCPAPRAEEGSRSSRGCHATSPSPQLSAYNRLRGLVSLSPPSILPREHRPMFTASEVSQANSPGAVRWHTWKHKARASIYSQAPPKLPELAHSPATSRSSLNLLQVGKHGSRTQAITPQVPCQLCVWPTCKPCLPCGAGAHREDVKAIPVKPIRPPGDGISIKAVKDRHSAREALLLALLRGRCVFTTTLREGWGRLCARPAPH